MPRADQKSPTLPLKIYKVAEIGAKRTKMSVAGYIGYLILKDNPKEYDQLGAKGGD